MKEGTHVILLSKRLVKQLSLLCKKIEIAGSIRRKNKEPKDTEILNKTKISVSKTFKDKKKKVSDIDIVLIPKNKEKLVEFMKSKGYNYLQGGEHESTWRVDGVKVELYYTTTEEWGAELLAYSSKKGSGIGLRIVARLKGFKLNNHGLFDRKTGKRIAGKTEREIYSALGRKYKEPWER